MLHKLPKKDSLTLIEVLGYKVKCMRYTKYKDHLHQLQKIPCFKASYARDLGVPPRMLAYFCHLGMIERIGRGFYRGCLFESELTNGIEDLMVTTQSIPRGIVCLLSALYLYELTDQMLREYWVAIPNAFKSPKRPHTRIVRMRNVSLGLTTFTLGEFTVAIFDRERTVIDAFRYLNHEIAIKALQSYLKLPKNLQSMDRLAAYAKTLRVNITPYILALTT